MPPQRKGTCSYEGMVGRQDAEAVLRPSDGLPSDDFGCSVAISCDRDLGGVQTHDWEGVPDAGAAYVFRRVVVDESGGRA